MRHVALKAAESAKIGTELIGWQEGMDF